MRGVKSKILNSDSNSNNKYDHDHCFDIYISDSKHDEDAYYFGRPLTFDECMHELFLLHKEYFDGALDPWCDGTLFNAKNYRDFTIDVSCYQAKEDGSTYIGSTFGFIAGAINSRKYPRFICAGGGDLNTTALTDSQKTILRDFINKAYDYERSFTGEINSDGKKK